MDSLKIKRSGASQKAVVDRKRFPEEARLCLDLLDRFFAGGITYRQLAEETARIRKKQMEFVR